MTDLTCIWPASDNTSILEKTFNRKLSQTHRGQEVPVDYHICVLLTSIPKDNLQTYYLKNVQWQPKPEWCIKSLRVYEKYKQSNYRLTEPQNPILTNDKTIRPCTNLNPVQGPVTWKQLNSRMVSVLYHVFMFLCDFERLSVAVWLIYSGEVAGHKTFLLTGSQSGPCRQRWGPSSLTPLAGILCVGGRYRRTESAWKRRQMSLLLPVLFMFQSML